ncbi:MAG TPA: helix-turn-helix domain-containing protein [Microlunatus sp.]|nr:helix-turn-helix domain-containing protein [Microlunatus sp.]
MPRSQEQNAALRAATRDRILTAAVTLFARRGFAATGVEEIARDAGVSTGLIYRHFRTKDDLFGAIVDLATAGLDAVTERFGGDGPADDLLRDFVTEVLADLGESGPALDFYLLLQQAARRDPADPRIAGLLDRQAALTAATARLIARGQRDGALRPGPAPALADLLFATLAGLTQLAAARGAGFTPPPAELVLAPVFPRPRVRGDVQGDVQGEPVIEETP